VEDAHLRREIIALMPDMPWLEHAPVLLVFLANGARTPQLARQRGKPFPNNHFDLLFNATVDGTIALTTFMRAAAAVGLGCCPLSAIRDQADRVSALLGLPERVIPVGGPRRRMARQRPATYTPRLGLETTLHQDCYTASATSTNKSTPTIGGAPLSNRTDASAQSERWGQAEFYGWSEDKGPAICAARCARTSAHSYAPRDICLD